MNKLFGHSIDTPIDEVLHRWWGYKEFRPMQREIIESILSGRDTLALMPTGGGKSLTYQVPAMAVKGLTIVITPLIALMKDQVDRLRSLGISAVAVHSGMDTHHIERILDNCTYGDVKLLYIAPERLTSEAFRMRLKRMKVSFVAVDEAHCISQWGYDFRPSYLRISEIRAHIPDATFLALTASATELVAHDIAKHLGFEQEHIIRSSFARPNLSYVVRLTEDKYEQLLRVINNIDGSGIVYMRTREGVEQLAEKLRQDGHSVNFYHAGLPAYERSLRQDEWHTDKVRIMVATNAFGMGIDKSDVRFVVHFTVCDSLEAYYQEAGRAGRDGKRSYAVLLISSKDAERIAQRFQSEFPPIEEVKYIYERISNHLQVAIGDGSDASFAFNIYEFCQREKLYSARVVSSLKLLEQNGYMTLLEESDSPARLMFSCSRDYLYKLNVGGNDMDRMLHTLLRMYDGLFSHFKSIDEMQIATKCGLSHDRVHELLKMLWRMQVIRYIPSSQTPMIHFDCERLPTDSIYISPDTYQHRYKLVRERFENMIRYATNEVNCRSMVIEQYFGDSNASPCGVCDICLKRKRDASLTTPEHHSDTTTEIIKHLSKSELSVKEVVALIGGNANEIVDTIDKLLRNGKISISVGGKLRINE